MRGTEDKYTQFIDTLRKASDEKLGVKSSLDEGCLVRDMRSAKKDVTSPREEENYLINAINTLRACRLLCEISGIDNTQKAQLSKSLEILFDNTKNLYTKKQDKITVQECAQILQAVERSATELLQQHNIGKNLEEKEHKLLYYAKNLTGLEDDHPDILTILPTEDPANNNKFLAIRSTKICKLTDIQQSQYTHLEGQAWYNSMPPWKRALMKKYKNELTDGKHVIPTQIRDVPGLRNAYTTEVLSCDPNNISGTQKVIYNFTHSATIASFSQNEQAQSMIASANLEELEQAIYEEQDNRNLHFFTLNTNSGIDHADQSSVEQTQHAVTKKHSKNPFNKRIETDGQQEHQKYHTNTPFNILRLLYKGKYDHLESSLNALGSLITEDNAIHSFLSSKHGSYEKASHNIQTLQDEGKITEAFADILRSAIDIKNLIRTSQKPLNFFKRLTGNYNVQILEEYVLLQMQLRDINEAHANNEQGILAPQEHIKSIFASGKDEIANDCLKEEKLHFACKSGKDRTGAMIACAIRKAIERHLFKFSEDRSNENKESLINDIIDSGHVQSLAGRSGGTPGCAGTKSLNQIFSHNSPNQAIRRLARDVAEHTNVKNFSSFINKVKEKILLPIKNDTFYKTLMQQKSQPTSLIPTTTTKQATKNNEIVGGKTGDKTFDPNKPNKKLSDVQATLVSYKKLDGMEK